MVVALGLAAGAVAGLFGVGGGVVFVPALTLVVGLSQLDAEATSLLAMLPVALMGSWRERHSGHIVWRHALLIGAASIVAAAGGAMLAEVAPQGWLRVGFALVLVLVAVQLALGTRAQQRAVQSVDDTSTRANEGG